jgi:23S rRNA (cytidine2498-2'-O)-methyltransferase
VSFRKRPKKTKTDGDEPRSNGALPARAKKSAREPARAERVRPERVRPAAKAPRSSEGSRKALAQRRADDVERRPRVASARGTRGGPRHDKPLERTRAAREQRPEKVSEKAPATRGRRQPYVVRGADAPLRRGERPAKISERTPAKREAGGPLGRANKTPRGRALPTRAEPTPRGRAEPRFTREAPRGRELGRGERAAKPELVEAPVRKTSLPRPPKAVERKRPDLSAEPHPGHFLLTTREGSEQDLVDELMLAGVVDPPPRVLAPALVLAPKVPKHEKRPINLTFARQGFPVVQSVHAHDLDAISQRVSRSLRGQLEKAKEYALHVWVPDSELGNPLAALADELEKKVASQLASTLPDARRVDDGALRRLGSLPFAQVCLIDTERAVAGVTYSNAAISLAKGGRTRVRVTGDFPSRAARKLEEAFSWLGVEPGPGESCVDLGAAPGGWTYVLANRRARVIAIDPAKLRPEILAKKGVSHIQESAFTYQPAEPVDWLFCDMAWRPLEAAALLAKWGRRRWARMMIANIKLPMTKKAEMIARIKYILENEGDWKHIRTKQLYHDRDEITLSAHVS